MHRIVSRMPSPALVIACIALFVALGGVSYAVVRITSRDIKNNTIRSRDVRNSGLLGKDIKRGRITGREVRESSLGTVPLAARAGIVDGHNLARLDWRVPAGTPTRTILAFGGLILNATCSPAGDLNLTATTSANNAAVHIGTAHAAGGQAAQASYIDQNDLDIGENVNAVPVRDDRVEGSLTYLSPGGSIVDVSYLALERTNGLASGNDCFVVGKATQSPA
jgi:hypothetical protein